MVSILVPLLVPGGPTWVPPAVFELPGVESSRKRSRSRTRSRSRSRDRDRDTRDRDTRDRSRDRDRDRDRGRDSGRFLCLSCLLGR